MDALRDQHLGFDAFRVDEHRAVLWRGAEVVDLPRLPVRVLAYLAARPGQVVLRSELRSEIWGEVYLGFDDRLNTCIASIRHALGDQASDSRYIQTVRGRGYRFIADVRPVRAPWSSRPRWRGGISAGVVAASVAAIVLLLVFGSRETSGPALSVDDDATLAFLQASNLSRSGRLTDLRIADSLLAGALERDPDFGMAHTLRASVASRLTYDWLMHEKRSVALQAVQAAERSGAPRSELEWARGMTELNVAGSPRGAISWLQRSIRQGRDDGVTWTALGTALSRSGRLEESVRTFRRALERDPFGADAAVRLTTVLTHLGRYGEALESNRMALALAPRRPEIAVARAHLILRAGGSTADAIEALAGTTRWNGMSPAYLIHVSPDLARIAGTGVEWEDARVDLMAESQRGLFLLSRGWLLRQEGRQGEAREAFSRAADLLGHGSAPDEPPPGAENPWRSLALALSGHRAAAVASAERALRQHVRLEDALRGAYATTIAAQALVTAGALDRAIEALRGELGHPAMVHPTDLRIDPVWAPLRDHPEWPVLIRAPI